MLIVDCEGCEKHLFDNMEMTMLKGCQVLVECHDFIDPETSNGVFNKLANVLQVERISAELHHCPPPEIVDDFSNQEVEAMLSEERPAEITWVYASPVI